MPEAKRNETLASIWPTPPSHQCLPINQSDKTISITKLMKVFTPNQSYQCRTNLKPLLLEADTSKLRCDQMNQSQRKIPLNTQKQDMQFSLIQSCYKCSNFIMRELIKHQAK